MDKATSDVDRTHSAKIPGAMKLMRPPAGVVVTWVSEKKILRRLPPERATLSGWTGLLDDRCVPTEEADFREKITDPSGGVSHEK